MFINPANTGVEGKGSIFVWHRSQWLQFTGAPTTEMLSFEYPLEKSAFGANVFYDSNGPQSLTNAAGYYSYMFNLSGELYMSLGLNGGIRYLSYDPSKIRIKDPGETYLEEAKKITYFNAGAGVTLFTDKWFIGLSSPNITPEKRVGSSSNYTTVYSPLVYLNGGANFPLSYNVYLQPSLLLRYGQSLPFAAELGFYMRFHDKFSAGLSYRLNAAFSFMLGATIADKFRIGYAFDLDTHPIRKYNYGSHEIFFKYSFETRQGNIRFQSPRFF